MQIFYNLHVIGAVSFITFGILHWSGNLNCSMLGLAVWAMDVAYRLYQTAYEVDVRLQEADGSRIISIVIPLEVSPLLACGVGSSGPISWNKYTFIHLICKEVLQQLQIKTQRCLLD